MKDTDGGESRKLPLGRVRPAIEDTSWIAAPRALSPEQTEDIRNYIRFWLQLIADKEKGVAISENITRLVGFGGFSAQISVTKDGVRIVQTELSLWYHPLRTEPMEGHQSTSVLDVIFEGECYHGQEWTRGKEFHLYPSWQNDLKALIEDPEDAKRDFEKRNRIKASRQIVPVNDPKVEAERNDRGATTRRGLTLERKVNSA